MKLSQLSLLASVHHTLGTSHDLLSDQPGVIAGGQITEGEAWLESTGTQQQLAQEQPAGNPDPIPQLCAFLCFLPAITPQNSGEAFALYDVVMHHAQTCHNVDAFSNLCGTTYSAH